MASSLADGRDTELSQRKTKTQYSCLNILNEMLLKHKKRTEQTKLPTVLILLTD